MQKYNLGFSLLLILFVFSTACVRACMNNLLPRPHSHSKIKTILKTGYFLGMHNLRFLHNRTILKEGIDSQWHKKNNANKSTLPLPYFNIYLHILTACLIKCIYFVLALCDILCAHLHKKPFVITERWSCLCWNVICSLCSHGNKHDMAKWTCCSE